MKKLVFTFLAIGFATLATIAQGYKQTPTFIQGPPQRTCGTEIPSQQWEAILQQKIAEFMAANPQLANAKTGPNQNQAVYTIPVIIHVIHGGQAVGTFPNLAQGQLNSQVQVLNDDFAGVGQNVGNYPATAFTSWATNTIVSAASKDGSGRIKISNTGVTFCLALKDTLGNVLTEPGIHRVDYNTLPALTGTFTSKNPAATAYNNSTKFMAFINGYIKPNTIWNVSKYLNIWVTDEQSSVGLLGYATFPPLSTLTGIPGGTGTSTSDGFWSWSASFGSSTLFPGGTYSAPYDKGRTCTHEIGHWVGLRHIWGDGNCLTDYCNDTPPASAANFGNPTYPLKSGSCASPSNAPNGEMFMNFMDYTDDLAMYMFTEDQRTRLQVAMANSPYRKFLGTHGLCSVPPPTANFSISPNPICAGQTATVTDMSTGSPGAWSYTLTGGSPATSTLQSPTVTYTAAGVYSITLVASNGGGSSTPVVKTITVNAVPLVTVAALPSTVCAGSSATLAAVGATTYSWNTGATTSSIVVTPTINTTYTVTGANGTCTNTKTISITVLGAPVLTITPASATICAGNSTTLTGSGATTYTWLPSGTTTASSIVTPTTTTTYTLLGSNGGTCISSKTVNLTVNSVPSVSVSASPSAICSGNSSTLSASGATTYSWNTGSTTSAIVVTPTTSTTYTVTGANGTCTNTGTISVNVTASPVVNITPASATICSGNSTTLTGSGATSYTWMPGSLTTTSVVLTPTANTIYTLTGANGICSNTKTVSITVNSTPIVNVSATPTVICSGSNATLTASGATTYSWNTGATTAVVVVTPSITTTYTVTGANGTCTNTKTVSVSVNPKPATPVATSNSPLCAGSTLSLSASTIAGASYAWTGPNAFNSTTQSPTILAATSAASGVYSVVATVAGCSSNNGTTSVVVNGLPTVTITANPANVCPGSTSTITAVGSGPAPFTYSWSTGATSASITRSVTGVVTVTLTNGNGCSSTQSYTLNSAAGLTVTATPNPATICSGSSATITATGASTYTWNTGATTAVIVITPSVTTTYTVVGTSGTCSGGTIVTLSVSTPPTIANAGTSQTICSTSTTLNANTPSVGTGAWSVVSGSGTITTPTSANSSVTGIGTGTNIFQWTITNGACSSTSTVAINASAPPTVANAGTSQTICASSGTLTGNTPSLGAGIWTLVAGMATITNPTSPTTGVTGLGTGNNVFQWSISNGVCPASTSTVSINSSSAPSIVAFTSSTLICVGQTAILTASSSATSYTWSTGSNSVSTTDTPSVTATYTVYASNAAGCVGSATVTQNVSPCLGIENNNGVVTNYGVYPNPTRIEISVTLEKVSESTFVEVYNSIGQLINKQLAKETLVKINLSEQADGVYHVRIVNEGKQVYKTKVIKD